MSSRVWRFTIWSLLGILVVLVLMIAVYQELGRSQMEGQFGDVNVMLAKVLRNSMVEDGLLEHLGGKDRMHVLNDAEWEWVDTLVRGHIKGLHIAKVKVYSPSAQVVYSSDRTEMGKDASDNPGVEGGLRGESLSGIVYRDKVNSFDGEIEKRNLHQQYIPLRDREMKQILGVFEVYSDVTKLLASVESQSWSHFFILTGVLGWFFLGQFFLYYRTDRALVLEQQQTKSYMEELEQARSLLEARVQDRTRELEDSRFFLQSVIDGIANPVMVINPDLTVSMLNLAAKQQMPEGRERKAVVHCYEVSHHLQVPCANGDHPCAFQEVLESGGMMTLRHTHVDRQEGTHHIDVISTPLRDQGGMLLGVIEVHHDVTELVRTQEGLKKSEARLQAIMDNVPDAILTYNESGRIETANRVAERLFGIDHARILGANIQGLLCSECVDTLESNVEKAKRPGTLEAWAQRGESRFPAELWIGNLNSAGERRFIAVVRDISQRKQAERELEQTRQQYYHQEKMAAIGQLAAGILHEVGNPIAAIAGAAEALRTSEAVGESGAAAKPDNLGMILEQTERLSKITREIADFASPRPMERELLDLNGLVLSTVRLVGYDSRFRGIRFDLGLDHGLPAINGVADQLTQVLMNLLINAMDALAEVAVPHIDVTTRRVEAGVEMMVRDNGAGMDEATLARAMEAFFTTKPAGKGTGLGLALCESIASGHGGRLSLESGPGLGTRVTLWLPDLEHEPSLGAGEGLG